MRAPYQHFMGIDIGKKEFVSHLKDETNTRTYKNNPKGFKNFFNDHQEVVFQSLIVLETTGGYEGDFLDFLLANKLAVHRADNRKVKNFIRSYGQHAKTDALDARALAQYSFERQSSLLLFKKPSDDEGKLKLLMERRQDLKQMLVQEKNRFQAPLNAFLKPKIRVLIDCIEKQIEEIELQINEIIKSNKILIQKREILMTITGVGETTANSLTAFIPELGTINRKQVASLCGVAPFAKQSGQKNYYRRTYIGRSHLRPILYMAAMAASRAKGTALSQFYKRLIENGKKPLIALVALMRKIVVIANARIKAKMFSEEFSENHS